MIPILFRSQFTIDVRLHGTHTDYFFSGRSLNGSASMGTDLLFSFLSTAEHCLSRAILERHHARATSELAGWRSSLPFFLCLFGFARFVLSYNKCRTSFTVVPYHAQITIHEKTPNLNSTVLHLHDHISTTTIKQYRTTITKQYRTTITPLASKQYSTYTVTIAPFSCLPREASFLREIRTLRQVAYKLHGYIYTLPTI